MSYSLNSLKGVIQRIIFLGFGAWGGRGGPGATSAVVSLNAPWHVDAIKPQYTPQNNPNITPNITPV